MTRRFALIPLALVSALVIAACGGSSNSGSSGTASMPNYGGSTAPSAPKSSAATATAPTSTVTARKTALGTFLVDAKGQTLYLWGADHGSMSTCNGECATDWPPLTTKSAPKAGSGVKASLLGTTKRADGTQEITYAGHPLYTFAGDTAPGQSTGQGSSAFGAPWWVVTPGGTALEN
jgi:predicted lipoprotein with Yx(FWY)xxD motif